MIAIAAPATDVLPERNSAEPQGGSSAEPQTETSTQRLFEPGGPTLEDLVLGAWEELTTDGHAECPVCGDAMSMLAGCEGCGSELG